MRKVIIAIAAAALTATPVLAYKLVPQGAAISVAKSELTVTPSIQWNRMTARPGRNAEAWTLDGLVLNELTFYGGVADGKTLFREVDKKNKPLPRFSATMLAPDVVQMFESSYRLAGGSSLFEVRNVEPATFAGKPGFRFGYAFTLEGENVRRLGEGTGAVIGGKLYMVTFEAPAIHYFERDLPNYRALVGTARLGAVKK